MPVLSCELCGVEFKVKPSQAKAGRRFCSKGCRIEWMEAPVEIRFQRFLCDPDSNGCINWNGAADRDGYGQIGGGKLRPEKMLKAHRVAFEIANGPFDPDKQVCHTCDNPRCCNPEHLFLGTNQENTADRHQKLRDAACERSGVAKLTAEEVLQIRDRYACGGASMRSIAKDFGVSMATVQRITTRTTWSRLVG